MKWVPSSFLYFLNYLLTAYLLNACCLCAVKRSKLDFIIVSPRFARIEIFKTHVSIESKFRHYGRLKGIRTNPLQHCSSTETLFKEFKAQTFSIELCKKQYKVCRTHTAQELGIPDHKNTSLLHDEMQITGFSHILGCFLVQFTFLLMSIFGTIMGQNHQGVKKNNLWAVSCWLHLHFRQPDTS